jgi:hypothetical protein
VVTRFGEFRTVHGFGYAFYGPEPDSPAASDPFRVGDRVYRIATLGSASGIRHSSWRPLPRAGQAKALPTSWRRDRRSRG